MLCFVFTIFVLDHFLLSAHARHVVCHVVSRSYLCPPISEAYYLILLRLVLFPVLPVPVAHHSLFSDCLLGFDLCLTTVFCACPFTLDLFFFIGLLISTDLLVCTPLSAVFSTPSPPHRPVTCWLSQLLFFCSANSQMPFLCFFICSLLYLS